MRSIQIHITEPNGFSKVCEPQVKPSTWDVENILYGPNHRTSWNVLAGPPLLRHCIWGRRSRDEHRRLPLTCSLLPPLESREHSWYDLMILGDLGVSFGSLWTWDRLDAVDPRWRKANTGEHANSGKALSRPDQAWINVMYSFRARLTSKDEQIWRE